jgi:hypothetical protein
MMRRITDRILGRNPSFYAVRYVEPDGTREVDIYSLGLAQWWERLCLAEGCTEVQLVPLNTDEELSKALRPAELREWPPAPDPGRR